MDKIKEEAKALSILNNSIDIVLGSLRQIVKDQMDDEGKINAFALLYALNKYTDKLKIRGEKLLNDRK